MASEDKILKAFHRHCLLPHCVFCRYREGGRCRTRYVEDVKAGRITLRESFIIKKGNQHENHQ